MLIWGSVCGKPLWNRLSDQEGKVNNASFKSKLRPGMAPSTRPDFPKSIGEGAEEDSRGEGI